MYVIRYNCIITVFLHNLSVAASIFYKHITSDLSIRTVQKALDSQPNINGSIILYSELEMRYTLIVFIKFCKSINITQSMPNQAIHK